MSRYRSIEAIEWALELRRSGRVGATEGDLLLVMACHVADKPMTPIGARGEWPAHHCWMTKDALAALSGRDLRTVRACLDRLAAARAIDLAGHEGRTTVFRLNVRPDTFASADESRDLTLLHSQPDSFASSLLNENEHKEVPSRKRSDPALASQVGKRGRVSKGRGQTWSEFRTSLGDDENAIPANDSIFAYCDRVGIHRDMLEVAFVTFDADHSRPNSHKRCADWREKFRETVRKNRLRLWFIDRDRPDSAPQWTTVGLQARNDLIEQQRERRAAASPAWEEPDPRPAPAPQPASAAEVAERMARLKADMLARQSFDDPGAPARHNHQ